ncbi:MAG: tRNA lysidine(34) synthetase TilS [Thermoanaerobaculia bacterium]
MPASAQQRIAALARAEIAAGSAGPWIVAFSGGPDSTALALALTREELAVRIELVHVDHGMDEASAERARAAAGIARQLGRALHVERRSVPGERRRGENLETAARRVRYAALESRRLAVGADRILTAHHRDDQAETVLLRLRSGAGVLGLGALAGIRERRGAIWRPALALSRAELAVLVAAAGIDPVRDPSNDDLDRDRNRIRYRLLPHLGIREPELAAALASLADRAAAARTSFQRRLWGLFDVASSDDGASLAIAALDHQPPLLGLLAVQLLEDLADLPRPSSRRFKLELLRQVRERRWSARPAAGHRSFRVAGGRLEIARDEREPGTTPPFSYTLVVPGEVEIPELQGVVTLHRGPIESWMFRGERRRAALRLPDPVVTPLEVRNRRPGDRFRPLGAPGMRALKDLLIDRKVPRGERDRIPLLVVGGRIAWVPGVTIAEAFRLADEPPAGECWIAEWRTNPMPSGDVVH